MDNINNNNNTNKQDLTPITTSLLGPADINAKNKFFEYLGISPDDYSDLYFTKEEIYLLRRRLQFLSTGSASALPLICAGATKCPFASRCPLVKIDEERKKLDPNAKRCVPLGRPCLVELQLLNEWTRLYMEEYQVGEESFTELQMVRELAEIEVMLWRLNNNLAKPEHANMIQEDVVAIDKNGNTLTRTSISSLFEIKERLQNRKSRLVKLMVGDRQEKYRKEAALKLKDGGDPSMMAAKLRREMQKQLDTIQAKSLSSSTQNVAFTNTITAEDLITAEIEKAAKKELNKEANKEDQLTPGSAANNNTSSFIGPSKIIEPEYEITSGMKAYNYQDQQDLQDLIDNPNNTNNNEEE